MSQFHIQGQVITVQTLCAVGNAVCSLDALKQNSYALPSSNARRANAKLALSPPSINKQSYQFLLI
jgi:hypothetical protein